MVDVSNRNTVVAKLQSLESFPGYQKRAFTAAVNWQRNCVTHN